MNQTQWSSPISDEREEVGKSDKISESVEKSFGGNSATVSN